MTEGTNTRVRGSARLTALILILSSLGATVLALSPWAAKLKAEGKNRAVSVAPSSPAVTSAKADLDVPRDAAQRSRWKDVYARLPLSFEANEGQSAPEVKFLSRGAGYALFLTNREAVLEMAGGSARVLGRRKQITSAVRLELAGSNPHPSVEGLEPLPGKSNYFMGNNSAKWRSGVTNYARVCYHDVYPGIDLVYYGNSQQLEYDFVVSPGADPRAIDLRVRGAKNVSLDGQGNLELAAGSSRVVFRQPVIYQGSSTKQAVQGGYTLATAPRSTRGQNVREVRFQVGTYDRTRPLVIDPALALTYSSYLGGSSNDTSYGLAVDSSGHAYLSGQTFSVNFPVKSQEQTNCDNNSAATACNGDAFVAKINSSGSALEYSTYLGGSSSDSGTAVAVDSSDDAYVTGGTFSTDFPTTAGVFQSTGTFGVGDAFVTELNPTGSALVFSTYLGGSTINGATAITNCGGFNAIGNCGNAIAVGASNNIYVAGSTEASNFPLKGAYQSTLKGTANVFVSEIPPGGAELTFSTYLGGAGTDLANAIAVSAPNVYVAGQTTSNNFPIASAYQSSYGGQADAFVSKLVFSGADITLGYSTYLGGTSLDQAFGLALDSGSNVYVTGDTQSTNFPTENAFQAKLAGGSGQDAFVAKLNSAGSTLVYSTYLGGSGTDTAYGVAVDSTGVAHVVGSTTSTNFPTANPIQTANNGNTDAFLTRLNPQGCGLEFSSYLGGTSTDIARSVVADSGGNSYLAGYTGSNNFPTQTPFQAETGGNNDAFVAKVPAVSGGVPSVCLSPNSLTFSAQAATTTSSAMNVTLTNSGSAELDITSIAASGPFAETNTCGSSVAAGQNCSISVTFSPTQAGELSGSVTITDNAAGASSATQTVELQGIGTDFGLAISPATASVSAGQSGTYTLTLTPAQDFTDEVALACNTSPALPAGTCTVSPTSITPTTNGNYTATVTVTTTANSLVPPGFGSRKPPFTWLVVLLAAALLAAGAWARRAGDRRLSLRFVTIAGIALLAFAWFGCGVSNAPPTHTPPGNYNIAVTGTDGSLNHVVHAVLTVN
jgi:Abnormal spindle-like microcephaly-assoc'd, ASPM-SPD-2-Hydin/Beta-propeller repeat